MSRSVIDVCKESYLNASANFLEITQSKHLTDNSGNETMDAIFEAFEGQGTESDPFLIQSAEDMWALSDITRGINFGDSSIYFKLTADKYSSATLTNCANDGTVIAGAVIATSDYGVTDKYSGLLVGHNY